MKICYIVAMEAEAQPFVEKFGVQKIEGAFDPLPCQLYEHQLSKEDSLYIVVNGRQHGSSLIGCEAASITVLKAIETIHPDLVVNSGTCGAFKKNGAEIGKVYIGSGVMFHDRRVMGDDKWYTQSIGNYPLSERSAEIAKALNMPMGKVTTGSSLDIQPCDLLTYEHTVHACQIRHRPHRRRRKHLRGIQPQPFPCLRRAEQGKCQDCGIPYKTLTLRSRKEYLQEILPYTFCKGGFFFIAKQSLVWISRPRIPTLCHQREFFVIARHEHLTELRLGDMSDNLHILHAFHLRQVAYRHCEEQFVVFSSIEGAGGKIHIELFCRDRNLIIYRDVLLVYAATAAGLLAYMHKF